MARSTKDEYLRYFEKKLVLDVVIWKKWMNMKKKAQNARGIVIN